MYIYEASISLLKNASSDTVVKNKNVGYGYGSATGSSSQSVANNNVPFSGKLTCTDKVIGSFWEELKSDENFKFSTEGLQHDANCTDILYIDQIDLNNDGKKEIIASGTNWALCSATGNCGVWIFGKKNGQMTKLLSAVSHSETDKTLIKLKNSYKNQYRIIELNNHLSGYETSFRKLSFNGTEYVEFDCTVRIYTIDDSEQNISCEEWRQR